MYDELTKTNFCLIEHINTAFLVGIQANACQQIAIDWLRLSWNYRF